MSESVASMGEIDGALYGISDEIRWGDTVTIRGREISVSKAVELGLQHGIEMAGQLEKDLKSECGLLVTFPLQFLMSFLQETVGTGDDLLELVKP